MTAKPGLYANIQKKRARIKAGAANKSRRHEGMLNLVVFRLSS